MSDRLPDVGTYWTSGALKTHPAHMPLEAYATCARCGSFVNSEDRHDEWHRLVEATTPTPGGDS